MTDEEYYLFNTLIADWREEAIDFNHQLQYKVSDIILGMSDQLESIVKKCRSDW